jgi:hypothetical protein
MENCVLDNTYNIRSFIKYLRHTRIRRQTTLGGQEKDIIAACRN